MIHFREKPALLQEWPITGWDGIRPRRNRERVLRVKIDLLYDDNSLRPIDDLVRAFQGLFQEEIVLGPDGKPMKLGTIGRMEAGPPLMFGKTDGAPQPRRPVVIDKTENYDPFENQVTREEKPPRSFRYWAFKFLGALFMRDKGTDGNPNMAISSHKTIGMVLFLTALFIWIFGGVHLDEEQTMKLLEAGLKLPSKWGEPPDMLVYSLWSALGLKGALDVARGFRK